MSKKPFISLGGGTNLPKVKIYHSPYAAKWHLEKTIIRDKIAKAMTGNSTIH